MVTPGAATADLMIEAQTVQGRSLWVDARRRLFRNKAAVASIVILAIIALSLVPLAVAWLRAHPGTAAEDGPAGQAGTAGQAPRLPGPPGPSSAATAAIASSSWWSRPREAWAPGPAAAGVGHEP